MSDYKTHGTGDNRVRRCTIPYNTIRLLQKLPFKFSFGTPNFGTHGDVVRSKSTFPCMAVEFCRQSLNSPEQNSPPRNNPKPGTHVCDTGKTQVALFASMHFSASHNTSAAKISLIVFRTSGASLVCYVKISGTQNKEKRLKCFWLLQNSP